MNKVKISKKIENMKKYQTNTELKTTLTELKNAIEGFRFNSRLDETEEKISELED